jgi:hypothetical protein
VELVIQKNSDVGPGTTVTTRSNSDGGFDFELAEQQPTSSEQPRTSRAMKGLSGVTVESGSSKINPFDPRLDYDENPRSSYGRGR